MNPERTEHQTRQAQKCLYQTEWMKELPTSLVEGSGTSSWWIQSVEQAFFVIVTRASWGVQTENRWHRASWLLIYLKMLLEFCVDRLFSKSSLTEFMREVRWDSRERSLDELLWVGFNKHFLLRVRRHLIVWMILELNHFGCFRSQF